MANELLALLALARSRPAGRMILATVVHVEGSAYRRPGSRMLAVEHGPRVGTISGGCLERDLLSKAFFLTEGGPTTIDYDTRDGDVGDFNLGCRGLIRVLLERLDDFVGATPASSGSVDRLSSVDAGVAPTENPLAAVRRVIESGESGVLLTVHGVRELAGLRVGQRFAAGDGPDWLQIALAADVAAAKEDGKPRSRRVRRAGGEADVLIERLDPPQKVVVFGAGHDVVPVVDIAAAAGCSVTIVTQRPGQAGDDRFAQAAVRLDLQPSELTGVNLIDDRTAVLVMTHDFNVDLALLPVLLKSPTRYIGLLGPKARTGRLLTELHLKGHRLAAEDAARLRTPVGLDIGGSTPQEIALSVVSEIIATKHDRPGTPLRDRKTGIHEPLDQGVIDASGR
jgi:xanthine dehydrogenase accessory factor